MNRDTTIAIGVLVALAFCGVFIFNFENCNAESAECAHARKAYIEHRYAANMAAAVHDDASAEFESCRPLLKKWGYTDEEGDASGIYYKHNAGEAEQVVGDWMKCVMGYEAIEQIHNRVLQTIRVSRAALILRKDACDG